MPITSCAAGYGYYKQITIDNTKVSGSGNLSNFPMLFSVTDNDLRTVANGGRVTDSNGYDIILTDTNGNKLDHEIERYVATTGVFIAWVRIPTLLGASDTIIYLNYGNGTISTSQENIASTWNSGYKRVYHMKETSGLTVYDSIGTANLSRPGANNPSDIDAKIGKGFDFAGSPDNCNSTTFTNLSDLTSGTIQLWLNPDNRAVGEQIPWGFANTTNGTRTDFFLDWFSNTDIFSFGFNLDGTSQWTYNTTTITYGNWYLVHLVQNGTEPKVYLNGVDNAQTVGGSNKGKWLKAILTDATEKSDSLDLGRWFGGGSASLFFDGKEDEFRITSDALSADWCLTEYNNMNSPSTFYSVGTETSCNVPYYSRQSGIFHQNPAYL